MQINDIPKFECRESQINLINNQDQSGEVQNSNILTFSFSSETPVNRWFGNEILKHDNQNIDLSRLNNGANVLYNHNPDVVLGVVEKSWIDNKRGFATVRFSKSTQAQEILNDIKDGIRRNVSVGYQINNATRSSDKSSDNVYVDSWQPFEISIVSVPADPSVGIGRSFYNRFNQNNNINDVIKNDVINDVITENKTTENQQKAEEVSTMSTTTSTESISREEIIKQERERSIMINEYARRLNLGDTTRDEYLRSDKSLDQIKTEFLEIVANRNNKPIPNNDVKKEQHVDLTEKEKKNYSILRAVSACLNNDWSKAGFEREVSLEIQKMAGRETRGFMMPLNLSTNVRDFAGSTIDTMNPASAGTLIAPDYRWGEMIDLIRNNAIVFQMGATYQSGLQGDIVYPRKTRGGQAWWLGEKDKIQDTDLAFSQFSFSPAKLGMIYNITSEMLVRGVYDMEMLVRKDISQVIALELDRASLFGRGKDYKEPLGLMLNPDIKEFKTNGTIDFDTLIDLDTMFATNNINATSMKYLTDPQVMSTFRKMKTTYGEYLWTPIPDQQYPTTMLGSLLNHQVGVTTQMIPDPKGKINNLLKHGLLLCDFSELIVGQWTGIEILPNSLGAGYEYDIIQLRVTQQINTFYRTPENCIRVSDIEIS